MIGIATTTIRIERPAKVDQGRDPYDPPTAPPTVVATGVRASFFSPSGSENGPTGSQEDIQWRLVCDPVDLQHIDTVIDETTEERCGVQWAHLRPDADGANLDHVVAGVTRVQGAAVGSSSAGAGRR